MPMSSGSGNPTPGQEWYAWFVAHGKQEQPRWDQWSREQQRILELVAIQMHGLACANLRYTPQPVRAHHETPAEE
jgi:hypothetical protein